MLKIGQIRGINQIVDMKMLSHTGLCKLALLAAFILALTRGLHHPVGLSAADLPVNAETVSAVMDRLGSAVQRADWAEADQLQEQLKRLGPGAIPFLRQRMKQEGIARPLKFHLLDTLRRIPGDSTTATLMEITLNDPDPVLRVYFGCPRFWEQHGCSPRPCCRRAFWSILAPLLTGWILSIPLAVWSSNPAAGTFLATRGLFGNYLAADEDNELQPLLVTASPAAQVSGKTANV